MSSRQIGFLQILLSGMCFGFLGYFGKNAFRAGMNPAELLSLRFLTSSVLLALYLLFVGVRVWNLAKEKMFSSFLLGFLGYAIFSSLYFWALRGLSASLTVLLLYTYPVLVTLGARFFYKEHIGKQGLLALVLALVGLAALVWGEWQISKPLYLMFGVGSAFFYSIYILISRKVLVGVSPMQSTFFIQLGAGVALGLLAFRDLERPLSLYSQHTLLIVAMAVVCSLFAMTLFQAGLQKLSASETSILSTSEPLFGVLIAAVLLHEKILPLQMFGGVLILAALILLAFRKTPHRFQT